MSDSWMNRGACAGEDPELFFPAGEGREFATQIARAKLVCRSCPVMADCLEYALGRLTTTTGIWGGLTDTERKQVDRRRRYERSKAAA